MGTDESQDWGLSGRVQCVGLMSWVNIRPLISGESHLILTLHTPTIHQIIGNYLWNLQNFYNMSYNVYVRSYGAAEQFSFFTPQTLIKMRLAIEVLTKWFGTLMQLPGRPYLASQRATFLA